VIRCDGDQKLDRLAKPIELETKPNPEEIDHEPTAGD